jgi:FkbM family methyltransferase
VNLHPIIKNILRPPYRATLRAAARLTHGLVWSLRTLLGPARFLKLLHFVRREMDITIEVGGLRFDASHYIPFFRAQTLFSKEPDTIAWIDDCVAEGDSFYDVGANIGVFTLYAATRKQAAVVAFEPSSENYAILNRNIYMNGLADRVIALNLALHDRTTLSMLNLSAFMPGKAGHGFSIAVAGSDYSAFTPDFRQGVIGYRLDDFVHTFDVPFPNHVKIDVDGNDPVVLEGMRGLLDDPRLKSVAIELNPDFREADRQVADLLSAHGFEKLGTERYKNLANIRDGLAHNYFFVRSQGGRRTS